MINETEFDLYKRIFELEKNNAVLLVVVVILGICFVASMWFHFVNSLK